ncbi:MAG: type IV pilus modification PilV family protein [Candidatus Xenobia bacterium]
MRRGFNLIEVMVASFILSLIFLALLDLLPTSLLSLKHAEKQMAADTIGASVLDEMRDVPFAQITPGPLPPDRVVDDVSYHVFLQTQPVNTLVVRVSWQEHDTIKSQYYVETLTKVPR